MSSDRKTANAVGGKTARACDSCMRKRARWYCTADDAFLCQACDASVHSANSLARRHERVRLKNASFKPPKEESQCNSPPPAWHQGFTRKARTPRTKPNKIQDHVINPLPLVPEMGSDVTTPEESDEQLLYQVPIFDPFEAEFCASTVQKDAKRLSNDVPTLSINLENDSKSLLHDFGNDEFGNLHGLLPSDMDLADFAADVETLLGTGVDEDSFGMEGLGLLESREENNHNIDMYYESGRVKMEDEEDVKDVVACHMDPDLDMARETLELNFDCESPTTGEEEDEEKVRIGGSSSSMTMNHEYKIEEMARKISLRLDYNAVIDAWSSQGLPWMTGDPPQFNPEDCWSDGLGLFSTEGHHLYGSDTSYIGGAHMGTMGGDGGREARVSRYREKRRTRLFSKKIRYEVRKLNAEKRPRMKGRFVKRTSFVGVGGPGFPF